MKFIIEWGTSHYRSPRKGDIGVIKENRKKNYKDYAMHVGSDPERYVIVEFIKLEGTWWHMREDEIEPYKIKK